MHREDSQASLSVKAENQTVKQAVQLWELTLQVMKTRQPNYSRRQTCGASVTQLNVWSSSTDKGINPISALDEDYMKYCLKCTANSSQA